MSDINQPPPPPPPPPPPGMGQPPYPGAGGVPAGPKNWMGILGIIASILGVVLACCGIFGLIPAAAGLVFGLLGRNAADAGEATNRGLAQAAFITGIVAVALSIIATALAIFGNIALADF